MYLISQNVYTVYGINKLNSNDILIKYSMDLYNKYINMESHKYLYSKKPTLAPTQVLSLLYLTPTILPFDIRTRLLTINGLFSSLGHNINNLISHFTDVYKRQKQYRRM